MRVKRRITRGRDRSRECDRNRRAERQNRINSTSRDRSRERNDRGRKASDRRIYVSNIPYDFRWQDLKDLFRTEVGKVAHIELFTDENDKPRGCGIVEFEDSDSVKVAVEKMHRYDIKGRKLVVKEDFDVERDKYGRLATARNNERVCDDRFRDPPRPQGGGRQNMNAPAGGGGDGGDSKFGNTYGLCIQFLKSLGINEPLVTRVFVANLDYTVDEKKLLEVFKLAGKVLHVEIARDKDGKSRGFGMVEYDHPVESVQAISMLHNQLLYDRRMIVRLDRANESDTLKKLPEGLKGIGMGLGAGGSRLVDVARNIPNLEANNPLVVNPIATVMATGAGPGLNNVVPAQLGVGGLSNLQASLASGQGNNPFARQGLSIMDNDVGFGGNNAFGGFNTGDNDRVPGSGGGIARNQGQEGGGNRQGNITFSADLPLNTTQQMLMDKFQDVGEVKSVEVQGTDMGMVQFASEWDAERDQ